MTEVIFDELTCDTCEFFTGEECEETGCEAYSDDVSCSSYIQRGE